MSQINNSVMHRLLLCLALAVVPAAVSLAQSPSPYAGQERRSIKALSEKEIGDLQEGRGMGLAMAAELNSFPGPLHVLELAAELGLSDEQRDKTQALHKTMRERAQALGGRIIEAERTLDRAFAAGRIDQASLQAQVGIIATLQGELRAVHLAAHLTQRALLTPEQVARYDALRGYQGGATPPGGHSHGRH
jgi:Spy/CpxP family protein refolding chaperone